MALLSCALGYVSTFSTLHCPGSSVYYSTLKLYRIPCLHIGPCLNAYRQHPQGFAILSSSLALMRRLGMSSPLGIGVSLACDRTSTLGNVPASLEIIVCRYPSLHSIGLAIQFSESSYRNGPMHPKGA
ncbi:hypothetical protein PLICRDRAFT_553667 [Plicaturopsis crispa FD-325 SS-3]|nr:hypothetical protein PLICRDRAFT_553667 [Plicaturopsis crispa FD-325 SS-3]